MCKLGKGSDNMTKLQSILKEVAVSEVAVSNNKVEQKAARALKERITHALFEALSSIADNEIQVVRTKAGVAIAIDNEGAGFIPVEVSAVIKNLDYDAADEAEAYQEYLAEQKAKADEKAKAKAAKVAKDKAAREAKAKAKAEQA